MLEKELQNIVIETFSRFSDIKVIEEPSVTHYKWLPMTLRPDIVIEYGHKPFAVIETKSNNNGNDKDIISRQFALYLEEMPITCYIAKVDKDYYYYSNEDMKFQPQSLEGVLKKLMDVLENGERNANRQKSSLESVVLDIDNEFLDIDKEILNIYKDAFIEHLKKGNLMMHGDYIYFDRDTEIELMCDLLENEPQKYEHKDGMLCRYTSAKSFFLSKIRDSFRLNSIESMNDAYETRVIDDYDRLKNAKKSVNDYLFNGYIMCFSDESRYDKLYNWYMYGGQAKGICFTINKRNIYIKETKNRRTYYVFAPIIYVQKLNEKTECNLLSFLNYMMNLGVDDKKFKFRFWHYWKYFFKYDYFEEEKETRLVCITDEKPIPDWNDSYNCPYYYIQRSQKQLPFVIKEVTLGPKCGDNEFAKDVFSCLFDNEEIRIKESNIKGFRG